MIAEWIIVGATGLVCYAVGRVWQAVHQVNADSTRAKMKAKADEVLDELPEYGPFTFASATFTEEQKLYFKCSKCPWSTPWATKLCGCVDYPKEHFHVVCCKCGAKSAIGTRDNETAVAGSKKMPAIYVPTTAKAPPEPLPPQPGVDYNACSCGSDRAKSAKLPSGVEGWQCLDCNCLRPKLVGGVTPISTN